MSLIPNYVPASYKTVNVFLRVSDPEKALAFYNNAFSAEIVQQLVDENGKIVHAEFKVADTIINLVPSTTPTSSLTQIFTEDAAALINEFRDAGGEQLEALEPKFYGAKSGKVRDPFGHEWIISTMTEQLTFSEVQKRFTSTIQR